MKMVAVDSSNVAAIGYDEPRKELVIEFKGGARHGFKDVPASEHSAFMAAESHGRHFHKSIRGKYPSIKMGGEVPPERPSVEPEPEQPVDLDEAIARFTSPAPRP